MQPPPLRSEMFSPGNSLEWMFRVPVDSPFFRGHFPGHPILPGVVALGWMLAGAERFLARPLAVTELLNVKFQVVILPGAVLEMKVVPKSGGKVQVTLQSEAGTHASVLIPAPEA